MRSDMGKVVIERPRRGHGRGYGDVRNAKQSIKSQLKRVNVANAFDDDFEDMLESIQNKQSMMHCYHGGYGEYKKEFTDLLGPIYRYLQSKVGWQWDDVWSEVCQNLRGAHPVEHVREHVEQFVERIGSSRWRYGSPIQSIDDIKYVTSGKYVHFYVDEDGILRNQIVKPKEKIEYKIIGSYRMVKNPDENYWVFGKYDIMHMRIHFLESQRDFEKRVENRKNFKYFVTDSGDEFVFVWNSWFTFEYKNLADITLNSSNDAYHSSWQFGIPPGKEGFTGVRFIKYKCYDIFGNRMTETITNNDSRNFNIRWKFRQASHDELKRVGLI